MLIYTLGTGSRSETEFVAILKRFRIRAFLDVRSHPKSRFATFNRERLEKLLPEIGIEYHFFGKALGGFRKEGYERYAQTEAFSSGVDRIEAVAREKASVIVCAETLPHKCHRRFIARELERRGWKTLHILEG